MPVGLIIAACCAVPLALAGAVLFTGVTKRVRRWRANGNETGPDLRDAEPREIPGDAAPGDRRR